VVGSSGQQIESQLPRIDAYGKAIRGQSGSRPVADSAWHPVNAERAAWPQPWRDGKFRKDFVKSVLRRAAIELDAYSHEAPPADDIDGFLVWLEQRPSSPAA
jgi:hypothetical protein